MRELHAFALFADEYLIASANLALMNAKCRETTDVWIYINFKDVSDEVARFISGIEFDRLLLAVPGVEFRRITFERARH